MRGGSGLRRVDMSVLEDMIRVFTLLRSEVRGGEKGRRRWENEHVQGSRVGERY